MALELVDQFRNIEINSHRDSLAFPARLLLGGFFFLRRQGGGRLTFSTVDTISFSQHRLYNIIIIVNIPTYMILQNPITIQVRYRPLLQAGLHPSPFPQTRALTRPLAIQSVGGQDQGNKEVAQIVQTNQTILSS